MKTKLIISGSLACLFLFSGCASTKYQFLHSKDEIESIEIVRIEGSSGDVPELSFEVVIVDVGAFLNDFSRLNINKRFTDPEGVYIGDTAMRIQYTNREFELITDDGQAKYVYSDYYGTYYYFQYAGYYYFDVEEFNTLIDKYISHS